MVEDNQIQWNTTGEDLVKLYKTNLTSKVAIVTGSNSGIGLETARVLALAGAKVIIPCRTLEKAQEAIKTIKKSVPDAELIPLQLDLSDLSSIKLFADSFLQLGLPLHLLVNNADGFETQFGVNHMGHAYLTQLLTDKLKSNASAGARIVCVSSAANFHFLGKEGLDFNNLNAEKNYSPTVAYGQAKFANILFAKELQRRFDAEDVDITVSSLHPGAVESNLGRHLNLSAAWDSIRNTRGFVTLIKEIIRYKNVKSGASTSIYCCVSPNVKKGEFYANNAVNRTVLNEQAGNKEMATQLWNVTEKLLAEKLHSTMSSA
ncbi:hypothetical protein PS6_009983 [Mucor atramentarius]